MTNKQKYKYIKKCFKFFHYYYFLRDKEKIFEKHAKYVIKRIPNRLYKYRECDKEDYNINILREKKVWFADPEGFNDKLDSLIEYDFQRYEQYLQEYGTSKLKKERKEIFNFLASDYQIRKTFYVFCLCERYDNDKMWVDYTNDGKGFCIEYNIRKIMKPSFIFHLFPIYYGKKKMVDISRILVEEEIRNEDDIAFYLNEELKRAFFSERTKEESRKGEDEWRIIIDRESIESQYVDFDYAESIILGQNIDSKNKNKLIAIAKEQNLNVYQRRFNATESKWEYAVIKL